MPRSLRAAALALLAAAAAAACRYALEPVASARRPLRDLASLPDGRALRAVSLGQRQTLADYYWLALVQYVGASAENRAQNWSPVYPVAELVTDLDPRFGYAYQEAGGVLSGLANRVDLSNRILEKGVAAVPDRWQLHWNLGFNKYFYQDDLRAAAEHFKRAAEVGKRPHLYYQSAALAADASGAEDYDFAMHVLEVALQETEPGPLRGELEERLVRIHTYKVLAAVERAAAAYRERHGIPPLAIGQLVAEGLLPRAPVDPAGGEIVWDPATGAPRSTVLGERKPLLTRDR